MAASDPQHDPVVTGLRERIAGLDRAILAAVNERIGLVAELRTHKLSHGWDFVDARREAELLDALAAANGGPLGEEGLRELFGTVLAVTKREVAGEAP
ncbi:MAG TPA: chorismate mutase [Gaiellaceae bacterium]|nr:chorismate mutase [Gaiellaceae bacterium]